MTKAISYLIDRFGKGTAQAAENLNRVVTGLCPVPDRKGTLGTIGTREGHGFSSWCLGGLSLQDAI
jgi:hypothetical protein